MTQLNVDPPRPSGTKDRFPGESGACVRSRRRGPQAD
jgi:hypothetical protein